jgi:O-antigen/teichoic acid export membrane protein
MASGTAVAPIKTSAPVIVAPPLRVSFSWTLAGNIVYSGCNWAMITVLAKLGSSAVIGQFALGLAIVAPVFMLTNLQLRGIQVTDSRSEFEFADYFTLRCVATAMGLATVFAIVSVSHYDRATSIIILLVAIGKVVESLSDVVAGLLQKLERLDQIAWSLMMKGLASLSVFAIVFAKFRNLSEAVAAMVAIWILVLVSYEFRLARRAIGHGTAWLRFNPGTLRQLGFVSLPLGAVMALGSLYTNIPRYALQHYQGAGLLGIFASLTYLGTASTFLINALGQSASARLSKMFAERQFDGFKSLLRKFILIGVGIGIVGIPAGLLFGRCALSLLYRPEYANYLNVFLMIIATTSVLAVASFLGYGLTAARCFKTQLIVIGSSTVLTALLSFLLIPRLGLMGAAYALFVASITQAVGFTILLGAALRSARKTSAAPCVGSNKLQAVVI